MSVPGEGAPQEIQFTGPTQTFADFDPANPTKQQLDEFADAFTAMRGLQTAVFGETLDAEIFLKDYAKKQPMLEDASSAPDEQVLTA